MSNKDMNVGVRLTADGSQANAEFVKSGGVVENTVARIKSSVADAGKSLGELPKAIGKPMDDAVSKLEAAPAVLKKTEISAAQTAAALRGVHAQFTDIVVALQGGQQPLTVFLQQGGQLKDMFGGAGNAAKALGGYVYGLVNPFTVTTAAAVALGVAYYQGSKENDAYVRGIVMTGNAAGVTAGMLHDMAASVGESAGVTKGASAEALAALVSDGNTAAAMLERAAGTAVTLQRDAGIAVSATVAEFAQLGEKPVEASEKLNEKYRYLTAAVYEQIRALDSEGKHTEAANLAQKTFSDAMDGRSAQMRANLGTIERAWQGVKSAASSAWDSMLNVGRGTSKIDELAAVRKQIAANEEQIARGVGGEAMPGIGLIIRSATAALKEQNAELRAKESTLAGVVEAERTNAQQQADSNRQTQARIAWLKEGDKYLSKSAQAEREIKEAREQAAVAGVKSEDLEKRIAAIREKYKEKGGSTSNQAGIELANLRARVVAEQQYLEQLKLRGDQAKKVLDGERLVLQLQEQLKGKLDAKTRAEKEAMLVEAQRLAGVQKLSAVEEARIKLDGQLKDAQDKLLQAANQETDAISAKAEALEEGNRVYGLGTAALIDLNIAQLEKRRLDLEATDNVIPGYIEALERQISMHKRLRDAQKERENLDSGKKAADESQKAWEKATDKAEKENEQLAQSLTDNIMRGGKSGAEYLEDLFRTMVLRPVISAIMQPVSMVINGVVGQGLNALGLGSGGGGIGSLFNMGSSLYGAASGAAGYAGLLGSGVGAIFGGAAGNAALGTALGLGSGSAAAAASAASIAGGGTAGLAGLGSSIAGAVPYIGLAFAAINLLSGLGKGESRSGGQYGVAFDGKLVNNRRGETYTELGDRYNVDGNSGLGFKDGNAYLIEADGIGSQGDARITKAISSTASGINAMLKGMGSSAQLASFFGGFETSGKGRGGVMSGGTLDNGKAFGESGTGDNYAGTFYEKFSTNSPDMETALANFSQDLLQSTIQALQAADDAPEAIKAKLKDVDAESLSTEEAQALLAEIGSVISSVEQFRTAIKLLPFENLQDMSFDAAAGLIELSGGIENLGSRMGSYLQNYYTDAERQEIALKNVQKAMSDLGYASVDTKEEFRALMEAQDPSTEEGRKLIAKLLELESAFAQVYPGVALTEDATAALAKAMEALRNPARSIEDVARNMVGLEDQLFALENAGNTDALRERQIAGWTDAEKAIQRHVWSLQKEAEAANERAGLEEQLLQLNGDTTALRALERAKLDETNRALYDSLKAREDELRVLGEREGLEQQLLQLNGDTAALRALERAKLDETNRALYDSLKAREDELRVLGEREGLEQQLLQLNGDTAALRALERAKLDETNRALYDSLKAREDEIKMLADAGINAASMADILRDGMLGRMSEEDVGAKLSDMVIGGIYNAMANQAAAAISGMFIDTIITPMLTAVTTGGAISTVVSQASIDAVVAKATAAAAAISALFNDEGFKAAIDAIRRAIGDIAGAATDTDIPKTYGDAWSGAAGAAVSAANNVKDAWQSTSDSIVEEIKRMKGEISGDGQQGLAYAQAQFAIATAKARAGDQDAAKVLPALNKTLMGLQESNAGSISELRRAQAAQIASMEATNAILVKKYGLTVPAFASGGSFGGGVRLVGEFGPELEVTGPSRIYSASQTQAMLSGGGQSNAEMAAELREVRGLLVQLLGASKEGTGYMKDLENNFAKVSRRGPYIHTMEVSG